MYKYRLLYLIYFFSANVFSNNWPTFNLLTATQQQLPESRLITIEKDPVYKTQKQYDAYPLSFVIKILKKDTKTPLKNSVLVFTAVDGYKVTMSYQDAIQEKGYIAFKDIDAKNAPWVKFKFGHESITPAPYYLVWPNTKLDKWRYPSPFQLATVSIQSTESYFSAAVPVSKTLQVSKGFSLFSRYCIRCHSVNHTGGNLGPELNIPTNITDSFSQKKLTAFILNATSFRTDTKMPVFKDILDETDALNIQHYLKSMKLDPSTTK